MKFDRDSILVDLELTSHCNAQCSFCPRDQFDKYGRMSFGIYRKVIERIQAMKVAQTINACGVGGDAAMHPALVEYVQYATDHGIRFHLVTNGSRIDRVMARRLIEAGIAQVEFSINAIHEEYEAFYKLPFAQLVTNVTDFLEESKGRCHFRINLPRPKGYAGDFYKEKQFWRSLGVMNFMELDYSNQVLMNTPDEERARRETYRQYRQFLDENRLEIVCPVPYKVVTINWEGAYVLCEHDYTRVNVLGHVETHSISEIQKSKMDYMKNNSEACQRCSVIGDIWRKIPPWLESGGTVEDWRSMNEDVLRVVDQI